MCWVDHECKSSEINQAGFCTQTQLTRGTDTRPTGWQHAQDTWERCAGSAGKGVNPQHSTTCFSYDQLPSSQLHWGWFLLAPEGRHPAVPMFHRERLGSSPFVNVVSSLFGGWPHSDKSASIAMRTARNPKVSPRSTPCGLRLHTLEIMPMGRVRATDQVDARPVKE